MAERGARSSTTPAMSGASRSHGRSGRRGRKVGRRFAESFSATKAIMGVFDEGCMGMYNAIIPDELLHPTGVLQGALSQSTLYARMLTVTDDEARAVYQWLLEKGMTVQVRPERGERPDRGAGARAVQDVHRRRAHRGRIRLRDHRHPVPAGVERPGAGLATWSKEC